MAARTKRSPTLADLEATVAKMRELGVTEFGDIKLGPQPRAEVKPPSTDELRDRRARLEERRRDLRFAASSIKPVLPPREDT